MEKEKLELVLSEILEEIKKQNDHLSAINCISKEQTKQIENFQTLVREQTIEVVPDMQPVVTTIHNGIEAMKQHAFYPQKMTKEYRLSLFKSNQSVEYYRTIFMWVAIVIAIILGYILIRHWMDLSYQF